MINQVYVIKDSVSEQCTPLFLAANDVAAKRQFAAFLKDVQYPREDFNLYHVGSFASDCVQLLGISHIHLQNGSQVEIIPNVQPT